MIQKNYSELLRKSQLPMNHTLSSSNLKNIDFSNLELQRRSMTPSALPAPALSYRSRLEPKLTETIGRPKTNPISVSDLYPFSEPDSLTPYSPQIHLRSED